MKMGTGRQDLSLDQNGNRKARLVPRSGWEPGGTLVPRSEWEPEGTLVPRSGWDREELLSLDQNGIGRQDLHKCKD